MDQPKKEFEVWFQLKQILAEIILDDIKEEWNAGFLPSIDTKTYQITNELWELVRQSFIYLKERGEIHIMENPDNGTNLILGESWLRELGLKKGSE